MKRRTLFRIAGVGGVVAATGGLSACSQAVPPEAIADWRGPAEAQGDLRRWVLGHAILAPHSHNLQSWIVDLDEPDTIVLYCDLQRLLPETDPFSRQIMMSHGTFLELIAIAAREKGLRSEIALFPQGAFDAQAIDALARDPIAAAGHREHFGHGLGHSLGLDIHEGPRLAHSLAHSIIPAGVILTVEPGIYLPDWGGVRIEDLILLTEDGPELLSHCPKAPAIPL